MLKINDDCLGLILDNLIVTDIINLKYVNKHFYKIKSQDILHKRKLIILNMIDSDYYTKIHYKVKYIFDIFISKIKNNKIHIMNKTYEEFIEIFSYINDELFLLLMKHKYDHGYSCDDKVCLGYIYMCLSDIFII